MKVTKNTTEETVALTILNNLPEQKILQLQEKLKRIESKDEKGIYSNWTLYADLVTAVSLILEQPLDAIEKLLSGWNHTKFRQIILDFDPKETQFKGVYLVSSSN